MAREYDIKLVEAIKNKQYTDESLAYARKLVDLGVDTTFTLYKGMGHAYIDHVGNYPQAEDCMRDISEFIKKNRR